MWRSLGRNGVATLSLGTPHDFFQGLLKLTPLVSSGWSDIGELRNKVVPGNELFRLLHIQFLRAAFRWFDDHYVKDRY